MADVANSVVPATSSSRFTEPNYWRDPNSGNAFQIQVELPQNRMQSVDAVGSFPSCPADAPSRSWTISPQMKLGTMPGLIERFNGQHIVSVTANIHGITLGEASQKLNQALAGAGAPPRGVKVVMKGEIPPLEQTISGLRIGLLLAVVVIFLLLSANFQSMRLALAIVLTVPAVLCGVLLMLRATGTTLNIQSFMGAIMAIGIAVANSILLITFAERFRHENRLGPGCGSRGRIQPSASDSDDSRGHDFRHAAHGDRIRRRRTAGGAAGPRGHRRIARLHIRDVDHPAVDLRHPARAGILDISVAQSDGSGEPIL